MLAQRLGCPIAHARRYRRGRRAAASKRGAGSPWSSAATSASNWPAGISVWSARPSTRSASRVAAAKTNAETERSRALAAREIRSSLAGSARISIRLVRVAIPQQYGTCTVPTSASPTSELEALFTTTALEELLLCDAAGCALEAELVVLLDEPPPHPATRSDAAIAGRDSFTRWRMCSLLWQVRHQAGACGSCSTDKDSRQARSFRPVVGERTTRAQHREVDDGGGAPRWIASTWAPWPEPGEAKALLHLVGKSADHHAGPHRGEAQSYIPKPSMIRSCTRSMRATRVAGCLAPLK